MTLLCVRRGFAESSTESGLAFWGPFGGAVPYKCPSGGPTPPSGDVKPVSPSNISRGIVTRAGRSPNSPTPPQGPAVPGIPGNSWSSPGSPQKTGRGEGLQVGRGGWFPAYLERRAESTPAVRVLGQGGPEHPVHSGCQRRGASLSSHRRVSEAGCHGGDVSSAPR